MFDFTKITEYSRLTNFYERYPYVPRKPETERKAREEIRGKLSPPLDRASVSAGGQGPLVVGKRSKGLAPSAFVPFGCMSHSFLKVLENESVGMGEVLMISQSCPP